MNASRFALWLGVVLVSGYFNLGMMAMVDLFSLILINPFAPPPSKKK